MQITLGTNLVAELQLTSQRYVRRDSGVMILTLDNIPHNFCRRTFHWMRVSCVQVDSITDLASWV